MIAMAITLACTIGFAQTPPGYPGETPNPNGGNGLLGVYALGTEVAPSATTIWLNDGFGFNAEIISATLHCYNPVTGSSTQDITGDAVNESDQTTPGGNKADCTITVDPLPGPGDVYYVTYTVEITLLGIVVAEHEIVSGLF